MTISHLHIKGFRSLADARCTLSPMLTCILGPNGSGKSSIAEAIQYALVGHCNLTDRKGAGISRQISNGAAQASIDIATDFGVVMRTITPSGARVSVGERTGKDAEAVLTANLTSTDLLMAMLRSDGFIGLPTKGQTDILFSLSGGEVNAEWVKSHINDQEREALKDQLATLLKGAALMDSLYKAAYGMRTEANANAKNAKAQRAAMAPGDTLSDADRERLTAEKRRVSDALTAKQRALGASVEQAKSRNAAQVRHTEANSRLDQLKTKRRDLGAMPKASDADLDGMRTRRQEAIDASKKAFQSAVALAAEADGLERGISEFSALGAGRCVLGDVACPLGQEQRDEAVSLATARVNDLRRASAEANETYRTRDAEAADLGNQIVQAEASITAANEHIRRAEDLDSQIAAAEQDAEAAQNAYRAIATVDTDETQREIDELQATLARIDEQISADVEARRQTASMADAQRAAETAQARADALDALVKKLEPLGLPAQAMAETVGNVIGQVNDVLSMFSEFRIRLEGETLLVTTDRGEVWLVDLSESEKLRVGAALQVAFAKLTGFGFVIVDAADRLDNDNRKPLMSMLLHSGVQAIVLATPLNGHRPKGPGVVAYDLVDGRLVAPTVEVPAQ
jgi:hypothetical protein